MATPADLRQALAEYVHAVHASYLEASEMSTPADRATLPLIAHQGFTVAVVGVTSLHILATTDALPAAAGFEVEITDAVGPITWRVRFFDAQIIPALASIDETDGPNRDAVRDVLGVATALYHLTVPPGGGVDAHHAMHAGSGLAASDLSAANEYAEIIMALPEKVRISKEFRACGFASLPLAQAALARELCPGITIDVPINTTTVRKAVLAHVRGAAS